MVRASSSSPSFCAARTANPRLAEIGNEAAFEDDDEEPEDDEEFKEHKVLLDSRAFRNLLWASRLSVRPRNEQKSLEEIKEEEEEYCDGNTEKDVEEEEKGVDIARWRNKFANLDPRFIVDLQRNITEA